MFCCHCNVIIFAKNVYDYNIYTLIGNVYNIYEKLFKQLMIVNYQFVCANIFLFLNLPHFQRMTSFMSLVFTNIIFTT